MKLIIKNGTIITAEKSFRSDLLIEDEKITHIEGNITIDNIESIDASGKYIIPGGVDVHTHLDMPMGKIKSRDDFESGTRAAAFGGTTTIIDYATQSRGMKVQIALDEWRKKAAGKSFIDYGFHMIIIETGKTLNEDIAELIQEGVTSFKLFMAYPGTLMVEDEIIFKVLESTKKFGGLVCLHAEDGNEIDSLVRQAVTNGNLSPMYHALTRPPKTEADAVRRAVNLADRADASLYIVHVSSAEALDEIKRGQDNNVKVYGETCPQYLFLSIDDIERKNFEGAKYVFTPPVRENHHQKALWDGIKSNVLQVVATDHCPFNFNTDKRLGRERFDKIPNGGPGIENRLHLLYEYGVNAGIISLNQWIEKSCTNPARIFGLYPQKGTIEVGSDADIVIWDPEMEHIISSTTHHMNVDYNLYEGYKIRGQAITVLSRGNYLVKNGLWVGDTRAGKYLKRYFYG
ncbi:MAG: dihydropyrimidinase [Ignavibacteriales bacterium]|nr:dihydropyrimidinase [Ignavibacteriales bacterium]